MTEHRHADLELLVDLTTTTHGQGRTAGAIRVESEFAAALFETHGDAAVPISWSSTEETFLELDRATALRYVAADDPPGEVAGIPVATSRPRHAFGRRVIVVTGSGWLSNITYLYGLLHTRRALGAELHVVVHDLVHLLFPQWASKDDAARYGSALEAILSGADRVLVYSESTARDIVRVAESRGLDVAEIGRMALGTAFTDQGRNSQAVSPGLEGLGDRPYVLYVSTVAARKNHEFIGQVWTRLAAELGSRLPRLVIAGRVAPDQEPLMERLRRDPALADHLVHISGATDADLAWLYAHCVFTVFPSLYEGWGLPVAESLALGKACLASDASSMPEVVGDATPLLDPLDIRAWCDAVRQMVLEPASLREAERRVRERYQAMSWADATDMLWKAIAAPLGSAHLRPILAVSATPITHQLPKVVTMHEPWRPVRTAHGAVAGYHSRLAIQLGNVPEHGLRLELSMSTDSAAPLRVETEINGLVTDGCVLQPGTPDLRRFDLPRDVLLRRGLLDVVTVARPVLGLPTSDEAPVTFLEMTAVALSRDDEAAALEMRRDVWRLGDLLHFTGGSAHLPLLRRGWGEPAHWGVWSVEPVAAISFRPMPQPNEPLVLRMAVRGFVPPSQPTLEVDVLVNGTRLATWPFRHPTDFSFVERVVVIPCDLLVDGVVHLQLSIPDARSPRELGMSQDERRLGLGLARAHCTTASGPQADGDWLRRRRR
jgi:glycosyltransferase involved in cell wall biosynthesis